MGEYSGTRLYLGNLHKDGLFSLFLISSSPCHLLFSLLLFTVAFAAALAIVMGDQVRV